MKIVLLPGLDGTGMLFKPFIDALPKEIDVVIISYPSNIKLGYKELIELVIKQLPEEKYILVGESFSDYIAYQVALRNPKNLKGVLFVATFLESPSPFFLGLSGWLPMGLLLSIPIPSYVVKTFFLGLDANKKMISLFKQSIKQISPNVLSYRLQEIAMLRKNYHSCKIKTMYIQASDDKLVPNKCLENFKSVFNQVSVVQMEGPHFILQANPLACAEVVYEFADMCTN